MASEVRTALDLERKYNFIDMQTKMKINEKGLTKVENELHEFAETTTADLDVLKNQVDGNVTTWFYSGIPTLQNVPASEWQAEDYVEHVGDLYYDTDTGYAYKFTDNEGTYSWERQNSSDIAQALALANAAKDTADNKRRVFVNQPIPPYDSGDLWINEQELYRCQISKAEGSTYADGDFIIATKYTDDTMASRVNDELTVLRGTVLTVKDGVDEFKIQFDTTTTIMSNDIKRYTEIVEQMKYSFGTDELRIAKSNDPVNSRINNTGMRVYSYEELKAIFNHKGSGIQDLIVVGASQIGNLKIVKAVDENGDACTDFHHLVSNIQTLEDLEV